MNAPTNLTDRSAELVKLALPLMSKHGSDYLPMSYAIWYEYVAGGNEALRKEVDANLQQGARLSDRVTFDLYNRHMLDRAEQAVSQARNGLQQVIEKMSASMAGANSEAAEFNGHLVEFGKGLSQPGTPEWMVEHVSAMIDKAQKMSESLDQRQRELAERQGEVHRLSEELSRVKQEVQTDALTGLGNRRAFDTAINALIGRAASDKTELTLLMLDIDHFKKVNDTYGHPFGDQVIRGVAQAIKALVKGQDNAARYGGEEFAILLPNTGLKGGEAVGNQIRALVERSKIRKQDDNTVIGNISVSVGVASLKPGELPASLLKRADEALYKSKQTGRNRVTLAD
jgi:diguanylate cyclase